MKKKKSIMRFAGMWKDNKEIGRIFEKIAEERRNTKSKRKVVKF